MLWTKVASALEGLRFEIDCHSLAKFRKPTVINSLKLDPWEAGSIVQNTVTVLYLKGNIDIVLYYESFNGADSYEYLPEELGSLHECISVSITNITFTVHTFEALRVVPMVSSNLQSNTQY